MVRISKKGYVKKAAKKIGKAVRQYTGARYGRTRTEIATKGVTQMAKDIMALKRIVNVEKKIWETNSSSYVGQLNGNLNGIGIIDITPNPAEGITYTTRNGRSIKLTGANLNMQFAEMSAQQVRTRIKIMAVQVLGNPFTSGATMLSELFDANPLNGIIDFNSDRNPQHFRQFKILATKYVSFPTETYNSQVGRQVCKKINLRLNSHIKFNNDTTVVVDGQIYLVVIPESGNASTSTASTLGNVATQAINTGFAWYNYTRFYFVDN